MIAAIAVLVVSFLAGLLCTLMLSFLLFSDRLGGIMNEDPKDFVSNRTHTKHKNFEDSVSITSIMASFLPLIVAPLDDMNARPFSPT